MCFSLITCGNQLMPAVVTVEQAFVIGRRHKRGTPCHEQCNESKPSDTFWDIIRNVGTGTPVQHNFLYKAKLLGKILSTVVAHTIHTENSKNIFPIKQKCAEWGLPGYCNSIQMNKSRLHIWICIAPSVVRFHVRSAVCSELNYMLKSIYRSPLRLNA